MVMTYRFLPGQKLNERALATLLNASRTPLREALNRLASEGFACRQLEAKEIFDLYKMRASFEAQGVRLATQRVCPTTGLSTWPALRANRN